MASVGQGRAGGAAAMGNLFGRKRRSRVTDQDKAVLVRAEWKGPREGGREKERKVEPAAVGCACEHKALGSRRVC